VSDLLGAVLQLPDDVAAGPEGIGHGGAARDLYRGLRLAANLGDEDVAGHGRAPSRAASRRRVSTSAAWARRIATAGMAVAVGVRLLERRAAAWRRASSRRTRLAS
jgi:hypothetical protein